jgi:hypothetical protein
MLRIFSIFSAVIDCLYVRSIYRAGSLRTVAGETSKYKLDLVAVQEVGWDEVGPNQQVTIHFSMERGMRGAT